MSVRRLTSGSAVRVPALAAYLGLLLTGAALFLLVRGYGETLVAPPPAAPAVPIAGAVGASAPDTVFHVLLALCAVVMVGRGLGTLLRYVGQPPVIGEVLAGILLGPSLLGRLAPTAAAFLLPPSSAPFLNLVAQIGVVLYMFLVGLELNADLLRHRGHVTVAISHASIVAPFVLGSVLALQLYPRLSTSDVSFTTFALFMGVAMSVTAFPVLARILSDRGASRTELGVVALTCAAADDVTAWCLLALVVGVAQSAVGEALRVVAMATVFIAGMFLVVRPAVARMLSRSSAGEPGQNVLALAIIGLLVSALMTEAIGIHAVFGAFLFGAVMPHDAPLARALKYRLEDVVTILLLPAFFAFTGMRTQVALVSTPFEWLMCLLIIVVATAGKFGGTVAAATLSGMAWRPAAILGVLMNTRGLMGLIVLNIGLDLHVISPKVFTLMVLMALVTTMATTPALQMLGGTAGFTPIGPPDPSR